MIGSYFKIGSAVVAVIAVAGLVMFVSRLHSRVSSRDAEIRLLESEKKYMAWQASIERAKVDTIQGVGTYTEIVDTTEITDTLYLEPGEVAPTYIPRISGFITLNTTRSIKWGSDSLSLRVKGELYYPARDSLKNWLLVYPESGKPPERPVARRSPKSWGIGLVYIRSVSATYSGDYLGASVRFKRLIVAGAYDPWRKGGTGTIGLRILSF